MFKGRGDPPSPQSSRIHALFLETRQMKKNFFILFVSFFLNLSIYGDEARSQLTHKISFGNCDTYSKFVRIFRYRPFQIKVLNITPACSEAQIQLRMNSSTPWTNYRPGMVILSDKHHIHLRIVSPRYSGVAVIRFETLPNS